MNIWNTMEKSKIYGDGRHSAATSLPCLASLGHLTADKREKQRFPQIAFGNFFYPQNVTRHCQQSSGGDLV